MPVYFVGNRVLFSDGRVAMDASCCCGSGSGSGGSGSGGSGSGGSGSGGSGSGSGGSGSGSQSGGSLSGGSGSGSLSGGSGSGSQSGGSRSGGSGSGGSQSGGSGSGSGSGGSGSGSGSGGQCDCLPQVYASWDLNDPGRGNVEHVVNRIIFLYGSNIGPDATHPSCTYEAPLVGTPKTEFIDIGICPEKGTFSLNRAGAAIYTANNAPCMSSPCDHNYDSGTLNLEFAPGGPWGTIRVTAFPQ